jgi:hypothetical protein
VLGDLDVAPCERLVGTYIGLMLYYQLPEDIYMPIKQGQGTSPNSAVNSLPPPFQRPKFRCRQRGRIASKPLISLSISKRTEDFPAPKGVFP